MPDADYEQLFRNGQLVWTVPHHREMLDRYFAFYANTQDIAIFTAKYPEYCVAVHPEIAPPPPAPPTNIVITDEQATTKELDPDLNRTSESIAKAADEAEEKGEPEVEVKAEKPKKKVGRPKKSL
jgi:hypothetical protein